MTLAQRLGNALACGLMRLLWRTRYTDLGPFRAIRRSALRGLGMADRGYGWTIEMQIGAARARLRVAEVPVGYRKRIGRSKISGTLRGVAGAGGKILWTILREALSPGRAHRCRRERLIVFSRFPVPGRAKTRLIPAIGAVAAAELQRAMTAETLRTVRPLLGEHGCAVEVRYAGGGARQMRRWLGPGLMYRPQGGGDLGRRMRRAFHDAFEAGCRRVAIIGTDCPGVSAEHIRQAFGALGDRDLALGPSADGGYWLVGLRAPADIFEGIAWGTPAVLANTVDLAERKGLSVHLLETLRDVDRPEDLPAVSGRSGRQAGARQWPAGWRRGRPYVSVVVPTLNEGGRVGSALRSAAADGAEIIVVDGGSTDDTIRASRAAGASVLRCPPGRAGQMNLGAAHAAGEALLFLHADTVLPAGFVGLIFQAMADGRTAGGAFEHATDYQSPIMSALKWLIHARAKYLRMPYGDQAIFVRRGVFEALGGFPDVPIAEDLYFMRGLRQAGRIAILPAQATTSGRRWRRLGAVRATVINQIIVAGCYLSVRAQWLVRMYRWKYRRRS